MTTTLIVIFLGLCIYPAGIILIHYASDWRAASKCFPRDQVSANAWIHLCGLRINNLLLINSSKVSLTENFLILSGSGLRGLLVPQIQIPYGNIKLGESAYIVTCSDSDFRFKLELDSDVSIKLNNRID